MSDRLAIEYFIANRPKVMRYRGKAMKRATGLMIELTSARTSPTTSRLATIARVVGAPGTLIPDSSFTASHNPAAFPIVRAKRSMAPSWQAHLCKSHEAASSRRAVPPPGRALGLRHRIIS